MEEELLIDYRIIPKYDGQIDINLLNNTLDVSQNNADSVNERRELHKTKLSRRVSYKLSRRMTQHMTPRQKIKLMMEAEFDEMDDNIQASQRKIIHHGLYPNSNNCVRPTIKNNATIVEEDEDGIMPSTPEDMSSQSESIHPLDNKLSNNIYSDLKNNNSIVKNDNVCDIDINFSIKDSNVINSLEDWKNNWKNDRSQSELSSISEYSDDFEDRLVFKLNLKRVEANDFENDDVENKDMITMTKSQQIANELLTTERSYVSKLKLIDQTFQDSIIKFNEIHKIFGDNVIPQIFSNVKSIYKFHEEFLLPQLEKKLANWSSNPGIGDIMKRFSPFLKLYTEYVNNFDNSNNLITLWTEKSTVFQHYLQQLQCKPECGHLALQHHMLEPVQRVPRYKLLLADYVKHLEKDAVDFESASDALQTVKQAANLSNEALRRNEKLRKILDLNEAFGGMIDLIVPGRELVMEGSVLRISGRDGSKLERHLFLFTDVVLLAQQQSTTQHHSFRLKTKLDVDDLQVSEQFGIESSADSFFIRGKERSLEIGVEEVGMKEKWVMAFSNVIDDFHKKKQSRIQALGQIITTMEDDIGERAPLWIKDSETTMCMGCAEIFTAFRRRHHCRACGIVVCKMCSTHKVQLKFDKSGEQHRVCDSCAALLAKKSGRSVVACPIGNKTLQRSKQNKPSTLNMRANETCIMNGYLQYSSDGKLWMRRWLAAHNNFVLYLFKAHQDPVAKFAIPLPGYSVQPLSSPTSGSGEGQEFMFDVFHDKKKEVVHRFKCEDSATFARWINVIDKLSKLEMIN